MRIPVQAELVIQAETAEAINRWVDAFTYTDACTDDCLYSVEVAGGAVAASFAFDPVLLRQAFRETGAQQGDEGTPTSRGDEPRPVGDQ